MLYNKVNKLHLKFCGTNLLSNWVLWKFIPQEVKIGIFILLSLKMIIILIVILLDLVLIQ